MSKPHKWIGDHSLHARLNEAVEIMGSHRSVKDRVKFSRNYLDPLQSKDFPPEHLHHVQIILHRKLDQVIATNEEIDQYARSLLTLWHALLRDLSKYEPEVFEIWTRVQ